MMIALLLMVPMIGLLLNCVTGRRRTDHSRIICLIEYALVCLLAFWALIRYFQYGERGLRLDGLCGLGLTFELDGFRAVYVLVASVMWLLTGILSCEYFRVDSNRFRFDVFSQLTLLGTLGVFMSDDFFTTFVFFEIMTLASYPWVVHEGSEKARRAGAVYLAIAIFGSMVTLMGLFMAYHLLGTLSFDALDDVSDRCGMILPSALILVGFAAKAGLFPMHWWIPMVYPEAPAPASALLSGVLSKTGMFGMLIISLRWMNGIIGFGNVLLALGLTTMLLGAVLALKTQNLKRILAWSSMSQIGYMTVGVAVGVLLGKEGGVAVSGAIMHMINHSLLKLTLFMAAGVVYMNTRSLSLNEIAGFGKGKPLLHGVFLIGCAGLAGVPLLNGYLGKTLIHEGLVEYAQLAGGLNIYLVWGWVFLFASGITTAYMLKLYIALFWKRNAAYQTSYDRVNRSYMNRWTATVLLISTAMIPLFGMFPGILETVAGISAGLTGVAGVSGNQYFSIENLKSGILSLGIGALAYILVCRKSWCRRIRDDRGTWERWANSCEKTCRCMIAAAMDSVTAILRALSGLTDGIALLLAKTVFAPKTLDENLEMPMNHFAAYIFGNMLNGFAFLLNTTIYRSRPIRLDFVYVLTTRRRIMDQEIARVTRTVSFGLILFALGFLVALVYIILL